MGYRSDPQLTPSLETFGGFPRGETLTKFACAPLRYRKWPFVGHLDTREKPNNADAAHGP